MTAEVFIPYKPHAATLRVVGAGQRHHRQISSAGLRAHSPPVVSEVPRGGDPAIALNPKVTVRRARAVANRADHSL
jgi:hypothetical protein